MAVKDVRLHSWKSLIVILDKPSSLHADLLVDGNPINIELSSNNGETLIYNILENIDLLGHELIFKTFEFNEKHVNVTDAVDFIDFDQRYSYYGDDLGATYYSDRTDFKLWAPLASKVSILINGNTIPMNRLENGVYFQSLDGNFDGALYNYLVVINGKEVVVSDPYGKSSNSNGKSSAVINPSKIEMDMFDECLPRMDSYLDAIIYEANVRDMTIDPNTDIVNKGKFLGLIEKDKHTKGGNSAGFDYLKSLGFTHLQLMPVLDFKTVDENNSDNTYNWGYDPQQFFTLEGSYSLNPNDPYSRIIEFKKLVRSFHRAGIRINLDVVYNHVYEAKTSLLQLITPNYFFRRDYKGKFINHSFCGNDFASERPMARRIIVDSVKYLIKEYHIDGLRFDLMGLIDVTTMNEVAKEAKILRHDIMLYGEGWNMCAETKDGTPLANMDNERLIPDFAFFNDRYRNIVRGCGSTSKLDDCGYLLGNSSYKLGFEFVYCGSTYDMVFPKLFNEIDSSINYVECHDNATLFDSIKNSTDIDDPLRTVRKINKVLLLSFGIPFIHAGQEIGLSKYSHHNTYNEGDRFNSFKYDLLDERIDMAKSLSVYIAARKEIQIFKCLDKDLVIKNLEFFDNDEIMHVSFVDLKANKQKFHIFVNPSENGRHIELDKFVDVYYPYGYRKQIEKHPRNTIGISPNQVSIFVEVEGE
ncbi:MAG: type I pullulanase [Bacilli bacterium]|nr:type I pullulanase [Bacilli bacterium]